MLKLNNGISTIFQNTSVLYIAFFKHKFKKNLQRFLLKA